MVLGTNFPHKLHCDIFSLRLIVIIVKKYANIKLPVKIIKAKRNSYRHYVLVYTCTFPTLGMP